MLHMDRVDRLSISSPEFARALFEVFAPHLPSFPPYMPAPANAIEPRKTHSFNSNIRLYKYTEGQYFGCHYDDSVRDPLTPGVHSEWTILIYLSGVEDGVVGGEVRFHQYFYSNADTIPSDNFRLSSTRAQERRRLKYALHYGEARRCFISSFLKLLTETQCIILISPVLMIGMVNTVFFTKAHQL